MEEKVSKLLNNSVGTLLNLLFGTGFEMMDKDDIKQTTVGVWMSPYAEQNLLVFDIEGTDSKERGEQRHVSVLS